MPAGAGGKAVGEGWVGGEFYAYGHDRFSGVYTAFAGAGHSWHAFSRNYAGANSGHQGSTIDPVSDGYCDDGGPGTEYSLCDRGTDCIDCGLGKFSAAGSDALGDCLDCALGRYSATTPIAEAGCIECIAGKYIDVTGSDEASDCIDCAVGKYVDVAGSDDASDCIDCVAGTYIDVAGSDEVTDCDGAPINVDLYVMTGNQTYLDAALGGWAMLRESWQHVGGSLAINEEVYFPPKSYCERSKATQMAKICSDLAVRSGTRLCALSLLSGSRELCSTGTRTVL